MFFRASEKEIKSFDKVKEKCNHLNFKQVQERCESYALSAAGFYRDGCKDSLARAEDRAKNSRIVSGSECHKAISEALLHVREASGKEKSKFKP